LRINEILTWLVLEQQSWLQATVACLNDNVLRQITQCQKVQM